MNVQYLAQPDTQLGPMLFELLESNPAPDRVVFASAFVGLQTIIRLKEHISDLREGGSEIRFVFGIDLGGTSQEVLKEVLGWGIDVRIVKHRVPGHTFHPKLYLFQWTGRAEIIIGSNNITEGGFFGNYEGAAHIVYEFPDDFAEFHAACSELNRFLDPGGPTAYQLTDDFLKELVARGEILTEAEARLGRDIGGKRKQKNQGAAQEGGPLFGTEDIKSPPPLPTELLERLMKAVRARRQENRKAKKKAQKKAESGRPPIDKTASDILLPAAFYMTLPTLQGSNIPGEARIPLEAIELAKEFWGWPDEYSKDISPRAGKERIYWNWRPNWQIWSIESPNEITTLRVRMYMYENSSDFRFYVRPLVNAGGDLGDVVRIRRIAQPDAEYECVLARQGTAEYAEWVQHCTQNVTNSTRHFGYA